MKLRQARAEDLEAIVGLFAADEIGGHDDHWSPQDRPAYERAFGRIAESAASTLYVAEVGGMVVGTFQLTFTPVLTGRGALRAIVEGVQVRADWRSRGVGATMMRFAEAEARDGGAAVLSLTSNKRRGDAHRFYERLGYARSHEGFKKALG